MVTRSLKADANCRFIARLALTLATALLPSSLGAQTNRPSLDDSLRAFEAAAHAQVRGIPEDWSSHHVVFSTPPPGSTVRSKVQADPRYWLQQIREQVSTPGAVTISSSALHRNASAHSPTPQRDWSVSLGSGAKVGAGEYPAKYSFTTNGAPSCTSDFVVFNTSLAGSSWQASIAAFNQLYKAPVCTGSVPSTLWAYNTGGTVSLSPILSLDGSQIAFIQTDGDSDSEDDSESEDDSASLVVLKWAPGGIASSPVTLTSNSSYPSCTAPCMVSLPLNGWAGDKGSAPFYDYSGSDTLFVGDASGRLHEFHPVFNGPPAEVTTGGFPVVVSQDCQPLADPVYDAALGLVFVGDGHQSESSNDGEVHAVNAATGAVTNSAPVCQGVGFQDGPILDPSAREVYFACGHDVGSGNCSSSNACLHQFSELAIDGSQGATQPLGSESNSAVSAGAFDNAYLNSTGSPNGDFYVCGNPGSKPTLYRVPIVSNAMGSPVAASVLSNSNRGAVLCSPVTEFFNSATENDWLFLSVSAGGSQTGCNNSSGCVYSFNATTPLNAGSVAAAGIPASGGSSGLVIDNIGTSSSTVANVYYSVLSNQFCTTSGVSGGCAVQASQNQLQ